MSLQLEKLNRQVALMCPTCGNTEFITDTSSNDVECPRCGLVIQKDDLLKENGENLQAHLKEITQEASKEIKKHFKNVFKNFKSR